MAQSIYQDLIVSGKDIPYRGNNRFVRASFAAREKISVYVNNKCKSGKERALIKGEVEILAGLMGNNPEGGCNDIKHKSIFFAPGDELPDYFNDRDTRCVFTSSSSDTKFYVSALYRPKIYNNRDYIIWEKSDIRQY